MKELKDLLHELRCDINYCKVSFENDTDIDNANETLLKVDKLVEKLTIPVVVGQSEQLKALLERLLEENMCSVIGDELIEEALKGF
jgi:hypothetical protein